MGTLAACQNTADYDDQSSLNNLEIVDYAPVLEDDATSILAWLTGASATPPARLLYDAQGARLFEQICETPEYYLTEQEESLLPRLGDYLNQTLTDACQIVEYGSGNRRKIELLLQTCPALKAHVPIDISKAHLIENAETLAQAFPGHYFTAVCADFFTAIDIPSAPFGQQLDQNIGFFPGSTIGNMPEETAAEFLTNARKALGDGNLFCVAVDRVKDVQILEAAYHDAAGASAAFSLNLIDRMNREFGATFDTSAFRYDATFNAQTEAIEMWWTTQQAVETQVAGVPIALPKGHRLLVEISRKFTPESLHSLASLSGYHVRDILSTPNEWYSLAILEC